MSFYIANILTKKIVHSNLYDPYSILGVDQQASEKEIRKAFKKIVKENNPDRIKDEEEKKKANDFLLIVGKAYNLLKDGDKTKSLFTSNKDSEEVLAIPKIIIDSGWYLFLGYVLLVMVVFPYFGFLKWRESLKCNSMGVNYSTVEMFYKRLNNSLLGKEEITGVRNLLHVICESEEVRSVVKYKIVRKEIVDDIRRKIREEKNKNDKNGDKNSHSKDEKSINSVKESSVKDKRGDIKSTIKGKSNITKKGNDSSINKEISNENKNRSIERKAIKYFIEQNYGYPLKDTKYIGYYILMDHLFRSKIFREEDKKKYC